MKIKLIREGGLMGKSKSSEGEFDLTDKEYQQLVKQISTSKKVKSGIAKDAHQYFLIKENQQKKHPISIDTIPQQHVKMIDQLISDLKTDTD